MTHLLSRLPWPISSSTEGQIFIDQLVFAYRSAATESDDWQHERQLVFYLDTMNLSKLSPLNVADIAEFWLLFERVLCEPASLYAVERVLTGSRIDLVARCWRELRDRMTDSLPETLVFLTFSVAIAYTYLYKSTSKIRISLFNLLP